MDMQPVFRVCPLSRILGLNGPFQKCLMFLLKLAWSSRFRLPVLITVGFMILDIRMQLEINVDIAVRHQHVNGAIEELDEEEEEEEEDGTTDSDNTFSASDDEVAEVENAVN